MLQVAELSGLASSENNLGDSPEPMHYMKVSQISTDKIREDVKFWKEGAEKCGFGFNLSQVVPKIGAEEKARKAA